MKTPVIDQLLRRSGRSLLWAEVVELSLRALFTAVVVLFFAVVLDAGFGFHRYGLAALDTVLIAVTVSAAWPLLRRARVGRFQERRTAMAIEGRLGIADNRLINALDFAAQGTAGVSPALCNEVIARGEAAAKSVGHERVTDTDALREAAKPAAVAVLALMLAYLVMPSVFHAVVPRLFEPFADHPPFTLVRFDVQTEPDPICFGKPATIRVALAGPRLPEQSQIVFVDDGVKSAPLPMFRVSSPMGGASDNPSSETEAIHFAFRVDRADESRRFYIQTPSGRSRLHRLEVDTSPLIGQAQAVFKFPGYTGWPDAAGPLNSAGIQSLTGTDVTLRVVSNVPLGVGELRLIPEGQGGVSAGHTVSLKPDAVDPHVAVADFNLNLTGRFELSLLGADGKPGVETLEGRLRALPDRAPKIDIVYPDRQVVVPEGWRVDVEVVAGDDIGVSRITMHHGLNDQPTSPIALSHTYADVGKTVAHAGQVFDPSGLGTKPGDVIHYYAAVEDNRPVEPQYAETPVHMIHVISMQQYLDLARTRYRVDDLNREFESYMQRLDDLEAQRDELLDRLEALREQVAKGEPLSEEQREEIAALESALNEYAEQAAELRRDLQERSEQAALYEFEDAYKQMLGGLGSKLQPQADQAEALASAMGGLSQGDTQAERAALAQLAERFALLKEPFSEETNEQTQTAEQDLERLRLAEAMIEQGERIRGIAQEQADLAVRMSSLAGQYTLSPDQQKRADRLADEQALLRDELRESAEALREASEEASDLLPTMSTGAMIVADQIQALRIVSTQSAAEKAARAGSGSVAHLASREAAEKLDSLLSDVGRNQAQASDDLDGCFKLPRQQLQNALKQMAAGRGVPRIGAQAGSGAGMSGAMSSMSMVGPAVPGAGGGSDSDSQARSRGGRGVAGVGTGADDVGDQAEYIHADAVGPTGYGVGVAPGVPTEYREQAEAYFRRIAEESR